MRHGFTVILAAVLLATPLTQAPAQAESVGVITLQGQRTAWVDVTLPKQVTIDYDASTFSGGGRFAGFYAENINLPVASRYTAGHTLGAVKLRDFRLPTEPGITEDLAGSLGKSLKPGRYRFYLIADGQAQVRLAFKGGPRLTLRPTHPASANVAARPNILTDALHADNTQPFVVTGKRSIVTSSIALGRFKAFLGEIHACVARQDECGDYGIDAGVFPATVIYPLGEFDMVFGLLYQPGVIPAGRYFAKQGALNATTMQYASGAAFTLSLQ